MVLPIGGSGAPGFDEEQQPQSEDMIKQAATTAQEKKKPRGMITQVGEWMQENLDPLNQLDTLLDTAAAVTKDIPVTGQMMQAAADVIPNRQEAQELVSKIPVIGKPLVGLGAGIDQGLMTAVGITPLAAIANQDASWNNRPAVLTDDDALSEAIYDIAKIITPGVIWKRFGVNPASSLGVRGIESGVEALSQDSAEDLIAGRTLAEQFGRLYGTATGSEEAGAKFTRQLIEGDAAAVQPFLWTWKLLNNYSINTVADSVFGLLGKGGQALMRNLANNQGNVAEIARVLGTDEDSVVRALTDTKSPDYNPDVEPSEVITSKNVGLKTDKDGVNQAALVNQVLTEINGGQMDPNDLSNFFYDFGRFADDEAAVISIRNAFLGKNAIEAGSVARARILKGTVDFIRDYKDLLGKDNEALLLQMSDKFKFDDINPRLKGPRAKWFTREAMDELKNFENYFEKYFRLDVQSEEGLMGFAFSRYLSRQAGAKLSEVAQQIGELQQKNLDYSDLVNNVLIPNQKFLRAALSPIRYAQRTFFLLGEVQQDEMLRDISILMGETPGVVKRALGAKPGDLAKKNPGLTVNGERIQIKVGKNDTEIDTLEQLWNLSQQGNAQAKELFELAIENLRFGDPDKVLTNLALTKDIVRHALRSKEPAQRYFYNVVALGQISTPVNAIGATVFRQSLEPVALGFAAFDRLNRNVKPKDALYGLGMFFGGLSQIKNSFKAAHRAFSTNVPAAGKDRFTDSYASNLRIELDSIKEMHEYQRMQMQKRNANPLEFATALLGQFAREAAYNPWLNGPVRILMASDESAKVIGAGQHAWGRAFVNLWDRKEFSPRQMMAQVQLEQDKIFKGPAWKGEIIDVEVKSAVERTTLQESFNITDDSNQLERYFNAQQKAGSLSILHKVFNAFPRVAYRQIEQEYIENVLGKIPGAARINKRLRDIRSNPDPTQRIAIESQMALAQMVGVAGMMATMVHKFSAVENVLGFELPKITFDEGKMMVEGEEYDAAIDYNKFSPASVWLSLMSNATESFITGKTSEQTLQDQIHSMVLAVFDDIVGRNLLQGQQKFSRILNLDSPQWGANAFDFLWDFISPGTIKELANIIQPYETIQDVRTFPGQEALSRGARAFSNIQNPPLYDIYAKTKKAYAKPKVATNRPESGLSLRGNTALTTLYPGQVTATRYYDPVMKMLKRYDYTVDRDYLRQIAGVELDADQQSYLSEQIQGNLYKALAEFEKKESPGLDKRYQDAVKKYGKDSDPARDAFNRRRGRLNQLHTKVKLEAIRNSDLYTDPRIRDALIEQQLFEESLRGSLNQERQGLYAQAAKQDTPFAQQVRAILDIA